MMEGKINPFPITFSFGSSTSDWYSTNEKELMKKFPDKIGKYCYVHHDGEVDFFDDSDENYSEVYENGQNKFIIRIIIPVYKVRKKKEILIRYMFVSILYNLS